MPTPEFTYRIGWFASYEQLFAGQPDAETEASTLAEGALVAGRVILSGRGGGAKSVALRRLARSRLEHGDIVTIIDMKRWSRSDVDEWNLLLSATERVDFLLSRLGSGELSVRRLAALPPHVQRLILVDGLNEVPATAGQQVLEALEQFIRYSPNTGTIVADRLVRRSFPDVERWHLASILPIDDEQVRRLLQEKVGNSARFDTGDRDARAMLTNPYFLDALLGAGSEATSLAALIRDLFVNHAGLDSTELISASKAAFLAYREFASRTFPFEAFLASAGTSAAEKLTSSGRLLVDGDRATFDHHLNHDFLAAAFVVADSKRWSNDFLDAITFSASSFDALALALQQIQDVATADAFVRRIYDWNIYGAAYALSEGRTPDSPQGRVTTEMEIVMLAMLAIRRWDLITATATRARDALSLFPSSSAGPFLSATEIGDVVRLVDATPPTSDLATGWFNEWKLLFSGKSLFEPGEAAQLIAADDIIGWTFANAVRRNPLEQSLRDNLISKLKSPNSTVRWRIVHALGLDPDPKTAETLEKTLLSDIDKWVRYGAIRALVEIAALGSSELRSSVMRWIRDHAGELLAQDRVVRELKAAVAIEPNRAPADWLTQAMSVVEAFYELDTIN
ncbi:MAG TPA: HEAT repeat domain-containing protein [Candidatus Sulfotelmatobacter sp.]|nr:HEAT repeat domain-containing protein [Candidatus Sulfotelmatobacter sp.]